MGRHRSGSGGQSVVSAPTGLDVLIGRIADGDLAALGVFYDRTASTVYAYASSLACEAAAAEVLAVDTYTRLWRTARRFCPVRDDVSAWVARLAADCAADRRRQAEASTGWPKRLDDRGWMARAPI